MTAHDATLWLVVAAAAAGTFGLRASLILAFGYIDEVPPRVENALRFVPAAVLAGLAFPAFLVVGGDLAIAPGNHRLFAGALATGVAWRTENMLATIAVGMAALWTFGALLP